MKQQPAPKPPLNTMTLRHQFIYNPSTGRIKPKPTPTKPGLFKPVQVRTHYWRIDETTNVYREHRIVWALHHPENPNPKYVSFLDWNQGNMRIDNLGGTDTWPPPHNTPFPTVPAPTRRYGLFGSLQQTKNPRW